MNEGAVASAIAEIVAIGTDGEPHLVGSRCSECSLVFFPRDSMCPACLAESPPPVRLSNRGRLYSFSVVHIAPARWNPPYAIGYVDLPEGVRVFTHLGAEDLSLLQPDMSVELDVDHLRATDGDDGALYRFVPSAHADVS